MKTIHLVGSIAYGGILVTARLSGGSRTEKVHVEPAKGEDDGIHIFLGRMEVAHR